MHTATRTQHLPEAGRVSVVAAVILLSYALARFISLPAWELALQLPGLYLPITININTFTAVLAAALTATGADWMLSDHPGLKGRGTREHWLLPALTALVIGLPLMQLPLGPVWWGGFALGSALLMLVLLAEYIVIDPDDRRQPLATAGLTALSFALFLALATALRFANWRLFQILPSLALAGALVSLRTLHLRRGGQWLLIPATIVGFIIAQIAAALHYWPLSPVAYGLTLSGPAYALTLFMANLDDGEPALKAAIEPAIILLVVWAAAIWLR